MQSAKEASNAKYRKNNVKNFTITFFPKDEKLYEHFMKQPQKSAYLRNLIKKNMEENDQKKKKHEDCAYDGNCEKCDKARFALDCHDNLINPTHTKASFRARREMIGFSQNMIADLLDVNVQTVKRWERVDKPDENAPKRAWELLEKYRVYQEDEVSRALDQVEQLDDKTVRFTLFYYNSRYDYRLYHQDNNDIVWQSVNATIRQVAIELEALGYTVVFKYVDGDKYRNAHGQLCSFTDACEQMDSQIRKSLEDEITPCSNQKFIRQYETRHREKYGKDWPPYSEKQPEKTCK